MHQFPRAERLPLASAADGLDDASHRMTPGSGSSIPQPSPVAEIARSSGATLPLVPAEPFEFFHRLD